MRTRFPSGIKQSISDEIDDIFEIEQKCFPGKIGYSKRLLKNLILDKNSKCLVETKNGIIRAFLIVTYCKNSLIGSIETIDVDPIFQNKGIGLKLIKAAEIDVIQNGMRWLQLEVAETNTAALELYRKSGYTIKERIKNYYTFDHNGTCNAFRMIKSF
ncbi:GNAT family N-acetyltransferase [Candidatus Bathyarchaeota archaeon]|nr:GNAT family N-acetyltransferase [Candidatus Bathyarchaeota archaeon]